MEAVADPRYMFTAANQFLEAEGKPPLFNVQLVGCKKEVKLNNDLFSVHTDSLIKDVKKTDLIFIPALSGDMKTALEANKEFVPWIVDQYKNGARGGFTLYRCFFIGINGFAEGKEMFYALEFGQ